MAVTSIVRAKTGTFATDSFPGFGTVLRASIDPNGIDVTDDMLKAIRLDADFPKIPKDLCARIADLYVHMLGKVSGGAAVDSVKEVSVVLLRDEETNRKWRVLVPTQAVGGASVNADYEQPLCDIETGEEVTHFPPNGWMHAGSSHSHNTMGAFFSGTDDRNELPVPGVHFVFGDFKKGANNGWNFAVATSIVYHGKRYQKVFDGGAIRDLVWSDLMDFAGDTSEAHANVMNYIKVEKYVSSVTSTRWDGYAGYQTGFGYGLDDYIPGQVRGSCLAKEIPELKALTHPALVEWLRDFDKDVTAGKYRDVRDPDLGDVLDSGVPVFCIPQIDKIELFKSVTDLPGLAMGYSFWSVRQVFYGLVGVKVWILYVRKDGERIRYFGPIDKDDPVFRDNTRATYEQPYVELEPMKMYERVKWAKAQRRNYKKAKGNFLFEEKSRDDSTMTIVREPVERPFFVNGIPIERLPEAEVKRLCQVLLDKHPDVVIPTMDELVEIDLSEEDGMATDEIVKMEDAADAAREAAARDRSTIHSASVEAIAKELDVSVEEVEQAFLDHKREDNA